MEWYFERYIANPYDDVKVNEAVEAIRNYGQSLFRQILAGEVHYHYRRALEQGGPEGLTFEIIGDSPGFQAIYWESLYDPQQADSLAAQGAVFLRKNVKLKNGEATADAAPAINLLIVTARPNEEADVDYRTVQRPLIELIEETDTPVLPYILRPGTYEALVKHLDEKAGHYHIIHFDLHGALLDYPTYQQAFENAAFQNISYKAGYG